MHIAAEVAKSILPSQKLAKFSSPPDVLSEQYGIKADLFGSAGALGLLDKDKAPDSGSPSVSEFDPRDMTLRASAGISVFWTPPDGTPIRMDFSKILRKASYDKAEAFEFSTATQF